MHLWKKKSYFNFIQTGSPTKIKILFYKRFYKIRVLTYIWSCFKKQIPFPGHRHFFDQACCIHKENLSGVRCNPLGIYKISLYGILDVTKGRAPLTCRKCCEYFLPSRRTGEGPACTWKLLSAGLRLENIPLHFRSCRELVSGHCCPDVTTGSLKWEARSLDDGDFKRVRRQILRREWEPQSLSGFISIHGNQQSDRGQRNHYASWKVFGNSDVLLHEGGPMYDN